MIDLLTEGVQKRDVIRCRMTKQILSCLGGGGGRALTENGFSLAKQLAFSRHSCLVLSCLISVCPFNMQRWLVMRPRWWHSSWVNTPSTCTLYSDEQYAQFIYFALTSGGGGSRGSPFDRGAVTCYTYVSVVELPGRGYWNQMQSDGEWQD